MSKFNSNFVPEVRILFSDLLYYNESQILAKNYKKHVKPIDFCNNRIKEYRDAWEPKQKTILLGMQDIYQLNFYRPVIDSIVAPFFAPMSIPIILNFRSEPDAFIDILTHELFHNLFNDNHKVNYLTRHNLLNAWKDLFGKDIEPKVLVHIMVHAGLKAIYLDVLNEPYRLERDVSECQQWPAYKAAWDYVEQNGYREINHTIRNLYQKFS